MSFGIFLFANFPRYRLGQLLFCEQNLDVGRSAGGVYVRKSLSGKTGSGPSSSHLLRIIFASSKRISAKAQPLASAMPDGEAALQVSLPVVKNPDDISRARQDCKIPMRLSYL